jgi:hypothetical protein
MRVPAGDVEAPVLDRLRAFFSSSGEFAARNLMSGGAPVVIPARFTEDVRADFRAQNRLDFRRIVRFGVVMGWPSQSPH